MTKVKKKMKWKAFDVDVYSDVISHCVHFSSRPVNTNAAAVGIRLFGPALQKPYLSISTVGAAHVRTDYLRNGGAEAGPFKQISAVIDERLDEFEDVLNEDVVHIQSFLASQCGFEYEAHYLDPRLRQILWPIEDGDYLALTPLPSAGLCKLVQERSRAINDEFNQQKEQSAEGEENKKSKYPRYFKRTSLKVGGGKSLNAGGLVYWMSEPLVFDGPSENIDIKMAMSAYFKGVQYQRSYYTFKEFGLWLYKKRDNPEQGVNDARSRAKQEVLIVAIVQSILFQASKAQELIAKTSRLDGCCDESLSFVQQGLLNNEKRSSTWISAFSSDLANEIRRFKFHVSKESEPVSVALGETEVSGIRRVIEGFLR